MDKILFLDACVRACSRTRELAETLLQKLNGDVQKMRLYEASLLPLDLIGLLLGAGMQLWACKKAKSRSLFNLFKLAFTKAS